MSFRVTSDLSKLNRFVKAVGDDWRVRVGIFGSRSERNDTNVEDNASIGLKHELGSFSEHLPQRSWLTMPLRVSQREIIRDASLGAKELMALGRMYDVLRNLGFACEDAILAAFRSGGFGTWAPLKDKKANHAILIHTGQLRKSVASQVVHG
jgi:hypothetical protein